MTDIVDYAIVKRAYENYVNEISYCRSDRELLIVIKKFISFLKEMYFEAAGEKLRQYIHQHMKLARRILFVIRLKYVIIFVYHLLLERLVNELLNAIRYFISIVR
ncbi:hypothetical protein [Stygiolobus caldivivus]|uniref:Uncharacterized protein n=1 Tax=Stygiolobus caldivivus TaxID=2824673 RepID=A0A8D5U7W8_9CREN|nr:hypothetical protein [Stygiolobus caldivivus]BCU70431.1 hypothetical protein KN1_17280 [Stygiolobus caldivivus]